MKIGMIMSRTTHITARIVLAASILVAYQSIVGPQSILAFETSASVPLLSEIVIDPPSETSEACQYTELRGTPGDTVTANTYFLSVNSDLGNFGFANQAVNVSGLTYGSNGTIILFNTSFGDCPNRVYGPGTTKYDYYSALRVGTGSETYLIVQSTAPLAHGQDLDTNDDGQFDAGLGITVLDGFALLVNPLEEYVYGASAGVVNISNPGLNQPDAVTRFPANNTPFTSTAFYYGELAASPDETTIYVGPFSANFPSGGSLTPGTVGASVPVLNEIVIDPPSETSEACQYTELRGTPGGTVTANTYFLSVNSDLGNFGFANQAVNVSGLTYGSNGTITLFNTSFGVCPNRLYGPGTTKFDYYSALRVGKGSEAYLIVQSTTPLAHGQDLDTNDDGQFDVGLGLTVLDGFALLVNPEEEYVYGASAGVLNISEPGLDQPDAVTRFILHAMPFTNGVFYYGELAASPDENTAYVAPFSVNFPVASGGSLTPGSPNEPGVTTSADVEISGQVTTPDGRGLKNASVWIVDSQGVKRTVLTSSLGFFRFDAVASGETYIVGVESKRYRFESRLVQLADSAASVDFIGFVGLE